MRPERVARLCTWLRTLAEREDGTASVLEQVEHGDPSECQTRARLFREIAQTLEIVAGAPQEAVEAVVAPPQPPTPQPPPASPAAPVADPSRLEL